MCPQSFNSASDVLQVKKKNMKDKDGKKDMTQAITFNIILFSVTVGFYHNLNKTIESTGHFPFPWPFPVTASVMTAVHYTRFVPSGRAFSPLRHLAQITD